MRQRIVTGLVWILSLAALLAIVGSYGGRLWSWLDLVAHLRLALAFASAAVLVFAILARRRAPAWIAAFASVANLVPFAVLYLPASVVAHSEIPASSPRLRVLQFNVHWSNRRLDDVVRLVSDSEADIAVLQETMPKLIERIAGDGMYEFVLSDLDAGNPKDNGSALFLRRGSSVAIESSAMTRPLRRCGTNGWLEVHARFDGAPLTIIVGRMPPPKAKKTRNERESYTRALHEMLSRASGEVIVIGDLNETPFGSVLTGWLDDTTLVDSSRGFGYAATWPVSGWKSIIGIPIDHVLHTPGLLTLDRVVGADSAGSDHYPLFVTLERQSVGSVGSVGADFRESK